MPITIEKGPVQFNGNSIMLGFLMLVNSGMFAVGAWVATQTVENGKKLAAIEAFNTERSISNLRMEKRLEDLAADVNNIKKDLLSARNRP